MKIGEQRQNTEAVENGGWVDNIPEWGDLRLLVRGAGSTKYKARMAQLVDAVPKSKKVAGRITQAEQDRITSTLHWEVGLLGWENLEDDSGPIPYNRETARLFLFDPAFAKFRDAVTYATQVVGDIRAAEVEEAVKNSPTP